MGEERRSLAPAAQKQEKKNTEDKERQKHVSGRRRERRELQNTLPDPPCSVP